MARGAGFEISGEFVCGAVVRARRGAGGDVHGAVDCAGERVFGPAGIFARAVFSGAGWEFFVGIRESASDETFSACVAAGAGSAGADFERDAGFADKHRGNLGGAIDCAIYRAGRGIDDAAAAMGTGEVSIQDVAVPGAGGADDVWMGLAFLADRSCAEMGIAGDCARRGGVFDLGEREEALAV